jgi:diguanylate cyclase (GGDEF)-like protein
VVSVRYDHPIAVLMIDLGHFKQINDTRGHDAGDRTPQFVARALQAAVRPGDLVGRYGGEEFCVRIRHGERAAAPAVDRRMRAYLAETAVREIGVDLTCSASVAMLTQADETLGILLRAADAALYDAKARGRARTQEVGERLDTDRSHLPA